MNRDKLNPTGAEAQFNLAHQYHIGKGVERDYKKALYWYTKAAEQNNIYALQTLADAYKKGSLEVKVDYKKSFSIYLQLEKLSKHSCIYAEVVFNLGVMYEKGEGVDQDYKEAAKWFTKAADLGHMISKYNLGNLYENGFGVKQDFEKAFKLFELAAEQGYPEAQNALGIMYAGGMTIYQDYEKGFHWFFEAFRQGFAPAQFNLKRLCEERGAGCEESYFILGRMYFKGKKVKQDFEKAKYWFTKAADLGHIEAKDFLSTME